MYEEPTALDKLMGLSPHYAASTEYGIFCPGCSDPFKLSFVRSSNCVLAVNSVSRSLPRADQFAPWREAMTLAGLNPLPRSEYDEELAEHQMHFARQQQRWAASHRDDW